MGLKVGKGVKMSRRKKKLTGFVLFVGIQWVWLCVCLLGNKMFINNLIWSKMMGGRKEEGGGEGGGRRREKENWFWLN